MISLPPDFKEFLQALNRSKVKYLLMGGYAVAYHGYPRTTADLDVWIQVDPGNARRVMAALEQFGLGRAGASPELFLKPRQVIRMGVAPLRIEILTGVSGLEFETGFARRCREMLDGVELSIIHREYLLANQRCAGRAKDLADVEQLEGPAAGRA